MSASGSFLVILTAVLTMVANLMLRAGIDAAGGFVLENSLRVVTPLMKLFSQPLFVGGFGIYFLASVVWFRVVATEQLSLAYPILVSLTFMFVTGGAVLMFGEPVTLRKIIGLVVILTGIAIISIEKGTV